MNYALDTNIIIRYLRNEEHAAQNLDFAIENKYNLHIPKMVDYEIRRGFSIMPTPAAKKEAAYKILTERCPVAKMCENSWERALQIYRELYRKGFTVGEMDILIAAFCLEYDCTLVTNNTEDFVNIDGLELVDWTR